MCAPTKGTTTPTTDHSSSSKEPIILTNQKWILKRRPQGMFDPTKDVELVEEAINVTEIQDDEVVVENTTLSVDAFIRTQLDEEAYHGSLQIGDTITALGYGTIIHVGKGASKKYKVGSKVTGALGAQRYSTVKANQTFPFITFPFMKPNSGLGLMGLTSGLTAYTGIFYVASKSPRKGDTVVVTAAAGAVGSIAAQLAKSTGAKVIGVAGGPTKKAFLLNTLNLDGAVDYKSTEQTLEEQLDECCPDGIDFVYDNVGGATLDALLNKINPKGRIVICGAISQYSGNLNKGLVQGPSNYLKLAERGAEMKGFNVIQYMYKIIFALGGMWWLHMRGKVRMIEQIEDGIETFPSALHKLFSGGHIGKMLVNVKNATIIPEEQKVKSA